MINELIKFFFQYVTPSKSIEDLSQENKSLMLKIQNDQAFSKLKQVLLSPPV